MRDGRSIKMWLYHDSTWAETAIYGTSQSHCMRPMEQWKVVHKSCLVTLTIYSGGTPSNAAKRAASACNSASLAAMISSCASGCISHAATS